MARQESPMKRGAREANEANERAEFLNRIIASEGASAALSVRISDLESEMRAILGVAYPAALVRVVDEILAEFPTDSEGWAVLNKKVARLRAVRGKP